MRAIMSAHETPQLFSRRRASRRGNPVSPRPSRACGDRLRYHAGPEA